MKILEQDSLLANDLLEKARTRRHPEGVPQRGAASRSDEPFATLLAAAKRVRLASWQLPMGQQPPQVQDCIALTKEAANAHARWDPRVQPAALSFLWRQGKFNLSKGYKVEVETAVWESKSE